MVNSLIFRFAFKMYKLGVTKQRLNYDSKTKLWCCWYTPEHDGGQEHEINCEGINPKLGHEHALNTIMRHTWDDMGWHNRRPDADWTETHKLNTHKWWSRGSHGETADKNEHNDTTGEV